MAADKSSVRAVLAAGVGSWGVVKVSVKVTVAWKVRVACSKLRLLGVATAAAAMAAAVAAAEEGDDRIWVMLTVTGVWESQVDMAEERPEATLLSSLGDRVA